MSKTIEFEKHSGTHICIIYQYIPSEITKENWYHTWGLNVMAYISQGFENLGLNLKFLDLFTFLQNSKSHLEGMNYSLNLICGNKKVSYWGIVPSISELYNVSPLPNKADVIIAGERKDLANSLASKVGLKCPEWFNSIHEILDTSKFYIGKPRDYGSSVGIVHGSIDKLKNTDQIINSPYIYQEFIEGVDVTVPLLYNPWDNSYFFGEAMAYIPKNNDQNWIFDSNKKGVHRVGGQPNSAKKIFFQIPDELKLKIIEMLNLIGGSSVARVDFRVTTENAEKVAEAPMENYYFIEINPIPTMSDKSNYVDGMEKALERNNINVEMQYIKKITKYPPNLSTIIAFSMLCYADRQLSV